MKVGLKGSKSKTYITMVMVNRHVLCAVTVLAEFGRIPWISRIRQNSIDWQNSVEFHGLAEFGRILWLGRIRQVAANCGLCIYVLMAATKEKLPVSGVRQLVIIYCRGTSAARSLKLLALPYSRQLSLSTNITVTYSSSRYW